MEGPKFSTKDKHRGHDDHLSALLHVLHVCDDFCDQSNLHERILQKKPTDLQLLPSLLAATIKLQNNRLRNNKSICNKHENL